MPANPLACRRFGWAIGAATLIVILAVIFHWCCKARQEQLDNGLIAAIRRNDVRGVVLLLQQGASPNAKYLPRTLNEIHPEIRPEYKPSVEAEPSLWQTFLKRIVGKPKRSGQEMTALIVALDNQLECQSDEVLPPKDSAIVTALIAKGADVNVRGSWNATPLFLAVQKNRN